MLIVCLTLFLVGTFCYRIDSQSIDESEEELFPRIVGGKAIDINNFPFLVSISHRGHHSCGGSIINHNFILTAAHCTHSIKSKRLLQIRAGSTNREEGGQVCGVEFIYMHPQYDSYTFDFDLAILELSTSLLYKQSVQPVALPGALEPLPPEGFFVTVAGWGKDKNGNNMPKNLMTTTVPIVNHRACVYVYEELGYPVTDRMFCAGYPEGGKDSCSGDSGGAAIYEGVQIGIVSWGLGCASPGIPGVYADVALMADFISSITNRRI